MKPEPHSSLRLPQGVLKVKTGYNPNSSSIGTVLYSFPYAVAVIGVIASVIALFLVGRKKKAPHD